MAERLRGTSREMVETARALRKRQTPAEARLWAVLRQPDPTGYRVRRQQPLGRYVMDFWIAPLRIAIELDGGIHDDPGVMRQDADRAAWLETNDICLLRFRNEAVFNDLDGVIERIRHTIAAREMERAERGGFRRG